MLDHQMHHVGHGRPLVHSHYGYSATVGRFHQAQTILHADAAVRGGDDDARCVICARQAAENITSVGVRKMNASTFISSNVEHNSSNSVCEQSASCTMLTDMNSPCCLAIASIEEIAEIGP